MKPQFIQLENCAVSVQTARTTINGKPVMNENVIVIDDIQKSEVKKGVFVLRINDQDAIRLIQQLSEAILSTPF